MSWKNNASFTCSVEFRCDPRMKLALGINKFCLNYWSTDNDNGYQDHHVTYSYLIDHFTCALFSSYTRHFNKFDNCFEIHSIQEIIEYIDIL